MSDHILKGFPLNWTFGSQNYKKETSSKETERLKSFTEGTQQWLCHLGPRSGSQVLRSHKVVLGLLHGSHHTSTHGAASNTWALSPIQQSESSLLIKFCLWWYTSIPTDTCALTPMHYCGKRDLGRPKLQNLMAVWCNIGIFFLALGHSFNSNCRFLLEEHLLGDFLG